MQPRLQSLLKLQLDSSILLEWKCVLVQQQPMVVLLAVGSYVCDMLQCMSPALAFSLYMKFLSGAYCLVHSFERTRSINIAVIICHVDDLFGSSASS